MFLHRSIFFCFYQSGYINSRYLNYNNWARSDWAVPNDTGQGAPWGVLSRALVDSVFTHSVDRILRAQDTKRLQEDGTFSKRFISYSSFAHFAHRQAYPKGMWTSFYRAFTVCHRAVPWYRKGITNLFISI